MKNYIKRTFLSGMGSTCEGFNGECIDIRNRIDSIQARTEWEREFKRKRLEIAAQIYAGSSATRPTEAIAEAELLMELNSKTPVKPSDGGEGE